MEMPHLGKNCSEGTCNKLDFLPMRCDACSKIFCNEHYSYETHNCPSAYKKNVQVPVCPLCNIPIPTVRGQPPDIAVGAHIDSDCQSDPAKSRRKVFTNRCSMKGCKTKEVVPVLCRDCTLNYCLKHRHPTDHKCEGENAMRKQAKNAALNRITQRNDILSRLQGAMDEDEAYARAVARSLKDESASKSTSAREEYDRALAMRLQQQEQARGQRTRSSSPDKCILS